MRFLRQLFGSSAVRTRVRVARAALEFRPSLSLLFAAVVFCLATALPALAAPPAPAGAGTPSARGDAPAGNPPPQIVNFQAVLVVGNLWTISGDVIDPAPGGLTVTFGGEPVSLDGKKVVTDANGHFTLTLQLKTDGSDNGVVSAQTVDGQGLVSNLALDIIEAN